MTARREVTALLPVEKGKRKDYQGLPSVILILFSEEVLAYKNLNWTDIVTAINITNLRNLLYLSDYNNGKTKMLVEGFTKGFDIGYRGPAKRKHTSNNLPLQVGTTTELWNKVMKEVKECRYAGPFDRPPCKYYAQSPLGLVPKSGGKT